MAKARISAFKRRVSDRDRLCYALVIAFGVCLLVLMIFFSLGYQIGEVRDNPFVRDEETQPEQKMLLIDEPNPVIRGIEITIAVGMIVLGAERLKTYKQRKEAVAIAQAIALGATINTHAFLEAKDLGVPGEELDS